MTENIGMARDLPPLPEDFVGEVQFAAIFTPVSGDGIKANVASAMARGLPHLDDDLRSIRIIASGPSAKDLPLSGYFGPTLALNGALKLFTSKGFAPTWWACCDPQEGAVMAFLDGDLPEETTYLVASKCHPSVFNRLRNHKVVTWHVSDFVEDNLRPIPCGSSITTVSIPLALRLGYPRQEIWGWDCCFGENGADHALPQLHEYTEIIDIDVDGRPFKSTRAWLYEAMDLGNRAWPVYKWLGLDVRIMGDGMLKAFVAGSKAELAPEVFTTGIAA